MTNNAGLFTAIGGEISKFYNNDDFRDSRFAVKAKAISRTELIYKSHKVTQDIGIILGRLTQVLHKPEQKERIKIFKTLVNSLSSQFNAEFNHSKNIYQKLVALKKYIIDYGHQQVFHNL